MSAENKAPTTGHLKGAWRNIPFLYAQEHQAFSEGTTRNSKALNTIKLLPGHLRIQAHQVKWAHITKGNQQPPGIHTQHTAPGTLASNYFQVWEQAELRIKAGDPPSYSLRRLPGPRCPQSLEDGRTGSVSHRLLWQPLPLPPAVPCLLKAKLARQESQAQSAGFTAVLVLRQEAKGCNEGHRV